MLGEPQGRVLRHLRSAIRYVIPTDRHDRHDRRGVALLRRSERVYESARRAHPKRWTCDTRDWSLIEQVRVHTDPRGLLYGETSDAV